MCHGIKAILAVSIFNCFYAISAADDNQIITFRGASDASAAVSLENDLIVVADDEKNILSVYDTNSAGDSVGNFDMTGFLGVDLKHPEADIEGAARIGDRIYWITSHGRNKDGKMRSSRHRFFATDIVRIKEQVKIVPHGIPCRTLAREIAGSKFGKRLGIDKATRFWDEKLSKKDLKKLAPKEKGLNIEGLCASADGKLLYIGLRNPQFKDKQTGVNMAIVVPLENPGQIIDRGQAAKFGEPLLWNLNGLGIRSLEYWAYQKAYYIVAGPHDGRRDFAIYRWSGKAAEQPKMVRKITTKNFTPEALTAIGNGSQMLILSDDGTLPVDVDNPGQCKAGELLEDGRCPNKHLVDDSKKTFKGYLTNWHIASN